MPEFIREFKLYWKEDYNFLQHVLRMKPEHLLWQACCWAAREHAKSADGKIPYLREK